MMNVGDRVKVTSAYPYSYHIPIGLVGVLLSTPHETTEQTRLYGVYFEDLSVMNGNKQGFFFDNELEPA
jgi:hypothetical protein